MSTLQLVVSTPVEAHQAMNGLYKEVIKPHTATGATGVLTWQTSSSYLRLKHRGAFHGPVLRDISEQVWFTDEKTGRRFRYGREVWKEFFKRELLEPKLEEYTVRSTGEVKVRLRRLSTEDLSDDEYSEFLAAVMGFACTELGVEFQDEGY
jgi:hypothetical protein